MDTKIFLQGFDSKTSSNTSEGLNVQFKGRRKLLPLNDVAEVISQYDQYREEREKCNVIRLTCQVNPICSNVLFNRITEIVKNEGSSGVSFINYAVYGQNSDNPCNYTPYDDDTLFSGVTYKKKQMSFWSGNSINYQGKDPKLTDSKKSFINIFKTQDAVISHDTSQAISQQGYHPTNAIRDTQLSNETTKFVYNCGLDIFNNHLIRSKTFKTVCKMSDDKYSPTSYADTYSAFNTIADLMRDVKGDKVIEKIYFPVDVVPNNARTLALHLYEYDDIYTFKECIENKLIHKYNGWVGFNNASKIKSYLNFQEDREMEIERPLMYLNGGDFVDMYPSRDLYSFLPKYNTYRKRLEKNWNYCVTYPSSSYTPSSSADPFSDIIECHDELNSLKAIYFDENTRADNGTTQLVIYSIAKHGLVKGDYVNIYKTYTQEKSWFYDVNGDRVSDYFNTIQEAEDRLAVILADSASTECYEYVGIEISGISSDTKVTVNEKILDNAEVDEIVDDYIFTVFNSSTQISNNWVKLSTADLAGEPFVVSADTYQIDPNGRPFFIKNNNPDSRYYIVNNEYINIDDTAQNISYKKVVGNIECDYYVRIFSKVPNFKFASGDTSNEYQLYKNNEEIIHKYQDSRYDFESHVSRLAFAKNIYADNIGEIVFTDDIDISNLHDNLGRPLTSLYLTIVKNNNGYKEWYGYDHNSWSTLEIGDSNVEYSHAFGKITCGIKTSEESRFDSDINSINRINNIGDNGYPVGYKIGEFINESGRTYTTNDGRVVRINDEEIWYDSETQFWGDLCYYDNYNAVERHIDYIQHRFNTAQRESSNSQSNSYFNTFYYDDIRYDDYDSSEDYKIEMVKSEEICNNKKEGYYYIPHYEIPIKTFSKLQTAMPDFLTIREYNQIDNNTYQFTTLEQHFLSPGDKAVLYYAPQKRYYNLITVSGNNDNYRVFTCNVFDEETNEPKTLIPMEDVKLYNYKLFKMDNIDAPSYCKVLKDGTCRVIWRDVLNNGFNMSDKTVEEYPFTNGAFYVNRRIELYLRRQDPHGLYELYDSSDIKGNITDFTTNDNYIKEADITC